MDDWTGRALELAGAGRAAALVTLLGVEGSTPREAGARMLVWDDGQAGSIGGGNLERIAADQARRMVAAGQAWVIQDYPLGPLLSQCCGGRVRLLIEGLGDDDAGWIATARRLSAADRPHERRLRLATDSMTKAVAPMDDHPARPGLTVNGRPAGARGARPGPGDEIVERLSLPRPRLALFGAGHVGQALARVLAPLPIRVDWFDSRAEVAGLAGVTILSPSELVAAAREGRDETLIMTHDHALDYALTRAALAAATPRVGLIGSKTKRARFLSRLRAEGLGEATLARLVCPIGLPQIRSKAPEAIAVSVAADLLMRLDAVQCASEREAAVAGL